MKNTLRKLVYFGEKYNVGLNNRLKLYKPKRKCKLTKCLNVRKNTLFSISRKDIYLLHDYVEDMFWDKKSLKYTALHKKSLREIYDDRNNKKFN